MLPSKPFVELLRARKRLCLAIILHLVSGSCAVERSSEEDKTKFLRSAVGAADETANSANYCINANRSGVLISRLKCFG